MSAAREGRAAATRFCAVIGALFSLLLGPAEAEGQEEVFPLEGLVVTASPTALDEEAVSSHVTVLDGDELRRLGIGSVADALRDVAGIHVVRSGSFGGVTSVFLRGGESDYALVLLDGVPMNQAGGGFDFTELTTEAVERVEIVRGPASALYGSDAVTGVIQVITRTGDGGPSSTISAEAGDFGRRSWAADVRGGGERAAYGVSVSHRSTDGIYALNNESEQRVLHGVGRFRPDARTRVQLSLRVSERTYNFPTDGSGDIVDENAFTYSDATTARISATRELTPLVSVEASIGVNEVDGGTDDAVDGPADSLGLFGFNSLDHFRRNVAEVRGHLQLHPVTFTAGVEYDRERQRSFNESSSEFGTSTGRSESRRDNYASFLHAVGDVGRATYQLGARLEDNERFGTSGTWQAGIASPLGGDGSPIVRASVGTAIKEPTFFENFATGFAVGNPELDPERSFGWEVGVRHRFATALTGGVAFFDQSFDDLIQYTAAPPAPGDPNFFNIAEADVRGVELQLDGSRGPVGFAASMTWLDTEVIDSGFQEGEGATFVEGQPLLRRPEWKGSVRGSLELGPAELSVALSSVGARADRDFAVFPAGAVTLDPYHLLSAGIRWQLAGGGDGGTRLGVRLRGENLLDETYQELYGFPAPGRALHLSVQVGLGR